MIHETGDVRQGYADRIADRYAAMVDGDARAVVRTACVGAALAAYDDIEAQAQAAYRIFKEESAKAEAEIALLKSDLERARYAPLGDNHHNAAACPHCSPKLASPPAPSGWQQRIAAMEPYLVTQYDDQRCFFCGEYSDGDHKPDCLWQNAVDAAPGPHAKDALPPQSANLKAEKAIKGLEMALAAAFAGSAENGSFFRQGVSGEWTPSVFMTLNQLRDALPRYSSGWPLTAEALTMELWQRICDLPDRTSSESDPDAAPVTLEELRLVVDNIMEGALPPAPDASPAKEERATNYRGNPEGSGEGNSSNSSNSLN